MVALLKFFRRISWDLVGFSTSTLCAIHCLAFPILVLVGTLGSGAAHNHGIENLILSVSAIIGVSSLVPSYLNHRKLLPLNLMVFGFILIAISRFNITFHMETILTTFGAGFVAIAHLLNWRICKAVCTP